MYARVENGMVVRLYRDGTEPAGALPVVRNVPTVDSDYQYAREDHYEKWNVFDDRVEPTFTITDYDLERERSRKLETVKTLRKHKETNGFTVDLGAGPIVVGSDAGDQAKIMGAKAYTDGNPSAIIDWSLGEGQWAQLDATAIQAIANALGAHVQAVFSHAKALEDQINAATDLPSLWAVRETQGWPGL